MTAEEAILYIENYGWSTTRLGLGRTRELLAALGDPQKQLRFIHVAGSNGKGSSCAMFDAILRAAGYKCGLYTSPYIETFCERIRVNGENIPGERLAEITDRVMQLAEQMEDHPSQFELVTAIAMQYFYEEKCDIVVLEVGMGGALDSTNVIDAPVLACITNIGLEHTEYLGDTLEEIARTKAGIIKEGCRCVSYDSLPEVVDTVRGVCEDLNVPFTLTDFSRLAPLGGSLDGQKFIWHAASGDVTYDLNLIGEHQLHNAALVLTGIEALREAGVEISEEAVADGLKTVFWPARLEVLYKEPTVILDGGHNPQCAEALVNSLKTLLPGEKVIFLAGVLADKDYPQIVELMLPYAKEFVCVTPVSGRALPGEEFASYIKGVAPEVSASACASIETGIALAMEKAGADGIVVIFGSLYLAGAARTVFKKAAKKALRKMKIKAREALSLEDRSAFSKAIVERVAASPEFASAETILVYEAFRGEVALSGLRTFAEMQGKRLVYPRCIDKETMVALYPSGPDAFESGAYGILEPSFEKSLEVAPEEIDLVLCPGTVFDDQCRRVGMGAGYYDRYLEKCVNAKICAVAFECQFVREVPAETWDAPMECIFTENRVVK